MAKASSTLQPTVALRALLAGIAGVVGSYAAVGIGPSFVIAPIESWLAVTVPDIALRVAITVVTPLGEAIGIEHLGQAINFWFAVAIGVCLIGALALAAILTGRVRDDATTGVALALALPWLAVLIITVDVSSALGAGIGSAVVVALGIIAGSDAIVTDREIDSGRRNALGSLVGTLAVVIGGTFLGERAGSTGGSASASATEPLSNDTTNGNASEATNASDGGSNADPIEAMLATAEERSLGVAGLEGLVSGQDFYEVDINSIDPDVATSDWSLSITGAVEQSMDLDYQALTSESADHRFATLRCVSDPINGSQIDTALWTGVPVTDLLDRAGAQGEYVRFTAADDYFQAFERAELEHAMLVYGMDRTTLPQGHGAPVRLVVPGHWGEIDVKWITGIEVRTNPSQGFWEQRGWHGTGEAHTVAKLQTSDRVQGGQVRVGGHAYAGVRGVSAVELSIDGGEWQRTNLSEPLPPSEAERQRGLDRAEAAWRQWTHTYDAPSGEHTVRVRAIEADGTVQPREPAEPYPRGSMGWVSKTIQ